MSKINLPNKVDVSVRLQGGFVLETASCRMKVEGAARGSICIVSCERHGFHLGPRSALLSCQLLVNANWVRAGWLACEECWKGWIVVK